MISILLFLVLLAFAAHFAAKKPDGFLPYLLAIGPFSVGFGLGGLSVSALWLFLLICFSIYFLLSKRGGLGTLKPYECVYGVFLIWCIITWTWAPDPIFSIRVFLKLSFPFLVLLVARRSGRTLFQDQRVAFRWLLPVAWVALLCTGGITKAVALPIARLGWNFFAAFAPFADFTAILTLVALVAWALRGEKKYLLLAALAAVSPIPYGIRTGILATGIGVSIFTLLYYKIRALPFLATLYIGLLAALFLVPNVRDHMFFSPDKVDTQQLIRDPRNLELSQIDSSGRFYMWDVILRDFWEPNPLTGSGMGATQAYFYSGAYGSIRVEHSGYVRLLADTGLIGLCLYVTANLLCMGSAWRVYRTSPDRQAKIFGILVLSSMPAMMVCIAFDNVFNYPLQVGMYPYAFTGMMMRLDSVARWERSQYARKASSLSFSDVSLKHRLRPQS